MVWGAFTGYDKYPLALILPAKITSDFVTIVYKAT